MEVRVFCLVGKKESYEESRERGRFVCFLRLKGQLKNIHFVFCVSFCSLFCLCFGLFI